MLIGLLRQEFYPLWTTYSTLSLKSQNNNQIGQPTFR